MGGQATEGIGNLATHGGIMAPSRATTCLVCGNSWPDLDDTVPQHVRRAEVTRHLASESHRVAEAILNADDYTKELLGAGPRYTGPARRAD